MSTLGYRMGFRLGTIVLSSSRVLRSIGKILEHLPPEAGEGVDWNELSRTPAMLRKGYNLSEWRRRNIPLSPSTPTVNTDNNLGPRSSLDPLI